MSARNEELAAQRIGTAIQIMYTVPADTQTLVTFASVTFNQSGYLSLWIVPSGDAPNDDNVIWEQAQVDEKFQAGRAVYWVMEEGGTIQAQAEKADAVTLRFDGLEIQEL